MTTVTLAERLDLPQAVPLADQLRGAAGDLTLDAAAVTHLGGLCLQVLLAARQSCRKQGRALTLSAPSEAMLRALADFGLTPDSFSVQEATP